MLGCKTRVISCAANTNPLRTVYVNFGRTCVQLAGCEPPPRRSEIRGRAFFGGIMVAMAAALCSSSSQQHCAKCWQRLTIFLVSRNALRPWGNRFRRRTVRKRTRQNELVNAIVYQRQSMATRTLAYSQVIYLADIRFEDVTHAWTSG